MENTGERMMTEIFTQDAIEHLHRYYFASNHAKNKVVLDIASGEGYGTNLLSKLAQKVYGVDISEDAINFAKVKYKSEKIEFIKGSIDNIPLEDNSVDLVVSFETIEHTDKQSEMMKEIVRVLKKDGLLIISSPDKKFFMKNMEKTHPFHMKELFCEEFQSLLQEYFTNTIFYNQKTVYGSLISSSSSSSEKDKFFEYKGDFETFNVLNELEAPMYNMALASNIGFEYYETSVFEKEEAKNLIMETLINEGMKKAKAEI